MKKSLTSTLRGALCALVAVSVISAAKADEKKETGDKPVSEKILKKYDADKNGVLDEKEKAAMQADIAKKKAEEQAKMLEKWDANKNGKIDPEEAAAMKAAKKEAAEKKKAEMEAKKAEKESKKGDKDKPNSKKAEAE